MKITRGNKLDKVVIGTLDSGQVFEVGKRIGILTNRQASNNRLVVLYLNTGILDELAANTMVRKMKAIMRVDY